MEITKEQIVDMYRKCATEIPDDVLKGIKDAYYEDTQGRKVLKVIIDNIEIAKKESKPICQDTGTPFFYVEDNGINRQKFEEMLILATKEATKNIPLRPNAIDPSTGANDMNVPVVYYRNARKFGLSLLMKGGGSENVSQVYSLPNVKMNAQRDLEGVRRCVLDAVVKAQGKGCPPYIIGVAVGGNISDVASLSKKQLLRSLNDKHINYGEFEAKLLKEVNSLGIGPLGLGGNMTSIGVKFDMTYRHPASFFVGVSFSCWALRRCRFNE